MGQSALTLAAGPNDGISKVGLIGTVSSSKMARTPAGLVFPLLACHVTLTKAAGGERHVGTKAAVYLTAVMEYLAAEHLELSGNAARKDGVEAITLQHLEHAIENDAELKVLACHAQPSFSVDFTEGIQTVNPTKALDRIAQ